MPRRKTINSNGQADVLVSSTRRCCLCFGLFNDLEIKAGQIAHLDHDPSNSSPDNLAWLCFVHHNEYDSKQSQGKGFTIQEVKEYRNRLYEFITLQSNLVGKTQIPITDTSSSDLSKVNTGQFLFHKPLALQPSIGNAYLRNLYINLPESDVQLNGIPFFISHNSLYFDTYEHIRYFQFRDNGGKEVDFRLTEPIRSVKKVHFLINSGNSKVVYANHKIGEIRLLFTNIHSMSIDLILGNNIREWAVGNQGDYVREFSSPSVRMAWHGMNKQGVNAVMDHLEINIPDAIQNAILEKFVFVHWPTHHPTDEMGVHFLVMAITVETWT